MKKLRLIQPWDLRIVRQKLNNDVRFFDTKTINMITCKGPAGVEAASRNLMPVHTGVPCSNAREIPAGPNFKTIG